MRGSRNTRSPDRRRRRLLAAAAGQPISSFSIALLVASGLLAVIALASVMFGWPLTASAVQRYAPLEQDDGAGNEQFAQGCPDGFVVDFAGLPAGTILGEQYASLGLHISAVANGGDEFPDNAIVFDSDAPPTHDPDLAVSVGSIAILAKNLNDQNGDGLVDAPDENDSGGKQIYGFDQAVFIGSFLFIDKDHCTPDKAIAYDSDGNAIKQVAIPLSTDGSVQTIVVDADNVSGFEIVYRDSAGLTGIEVCPPEATPTPSPSPSPTASPALAPTASPALAPTASPTPAPTASPTPAPTPSPAVAPTPSPALPSVPTPAALVEAFPPTGGTAGSGSSGAATLLLGGALALFAVAICDIARRCRRGTA